MQAFYYKIDSNRLNRGKLLEVRSGMYQGYLELHIRPGDIADPSSIPIRTEAEVNWNKRDRHNVLKNTTVAIHFPENIKEYKVVCDYDTMDGQCVVVKPLRPAQLVTHSQEGG